MSIKVKIIGVTGKARSGKDLFASMLADKLYPSETIIFSFADILKEMLVPLLKVLTPANMPPNEFVHQSLGGKLKETPLPSLGHSPRQLMQWLGTEWGRELVDQDIWTKVMDKRIEADVAITTMYTGDDCSLVYIIPDVRFDNEAQWLNGRVIEVVRPNTQEVAPHASEEGIKDYHILTKVYNDGTVHDLEKEAARVAQEIRDGRI